MGVTRRMHVTGYLGDEPRDRVFRFIDAACRLGCFADVLPVRRSDGTILAVAMYSQEASEAALSIACGKLARILGSDTELTTPWDVTRPIPGRGVGMVAGEVVADRGELTG